MKKFSEYVERRDGEQINEFLGIGKAFGAVKGAVKGLFGGGTPAPAQEGQKNRSALKGVSDDNIRYYGIELDNLVRKGMTELDAAKRLVKIHGDEANWLLQYMKDNPRETPRQAPQPQTARPQGPPPLPQSRPQNPPPLPPQAR